MKKIGLFILALYIGTILLFGCTAPEPKAPKATVSIDHCFTSLNVMQGLGQVTDVFVTVNNYGSDDAQNITLDATANNVETVIPQSHRAISVLPANTSRSNIKLTVDTSSKTQTTATVTVNCPNCSIQTVSESTSDCHPDYDGITNKLVEVTGKLSPLGILK